MNPMPERQILTVTQLNRLVRQLLETHLSLLWIEGEISNLAHPASGHYYFTLKDSGAQIRCAMFKNRSQFLRIQPQNGMKILIRGRISLYEGRGDYQLIVEHMDDAGLGALQRAFDELREKLEQEGLFSSQRKKAIPFPAKHIALITSQTGAALQDILSIFKRRWAGQPITLIPVPVQGAEAGLAIERAIGLANSLPQFDVILLARGGGSLEDLWCFNEERVARAIAASRLPIVTGVGHETDTTIADYAADLRAPTPSAAAELLSPDAQDWIQKFNGFESLLSQAIHRKLGQLKQQTYFAQHRIAQRQPRINAYAQHLDFQERQLKQHMQRVLEQQSSITLGLQKQLGHLHPVHKLKTQRLHYQQLESRLTANDPRRLLKALNKQVSQRHTQLIQKIRSVMATHHLSLKGCMQNLHNLSPLQTLERGFAIVTDETGSLISDVKKVAVKQKIHVLVRNGKLSATVTDVDIKPL